MRKKPLFDEGQTLTYFNKSETSPQHSVNNLSILVEASR